MLHSVCMLAGAARYAGSLQRCHRSMKGCTLWGLIWCGYALGPAEGPWLCKDIISMQHRVFCIMYSMYAHRWVAALQRCNRSIKDVHYEDLNSVSMLLGQPKAQSISKICLVCCICCILYVHLQSSHVGWIFAKVKQVNVGMYLWGLI